MSVTGEFRRVANDCIALLEASESGAARRWADRLHAARALATNDLSTAAARVQALDAGAERITDASLATPAETDEFRECCLHLLAIAEAITGRRSD